MANGKCWSLKETHMTSGMVLARRHVGDSATKWRKVSKVWWASRCAFDHIYPSIYESMRKHQIFHSPNATQNFKVKKTKDCFFFGESECVLCTPLIFPCAVKEQQGEYKMCVYRVSSKDAARRCGQVPLPHMQNSCIITERRKVHGSLPENMCKKNKVKKED